MASQAKSQSRRPAPTPDSFLEALSGLKSSAVSEAKVQIKKAITEDIPESFGFYKSGTLTPNQPVSLEQLKTAEKQGERKGEANARRMLEQERQQLMAVETQTKAQIQSLLSEIKSLALASGSLGQQVEIAAMQAPTHPGIYHRQFFSQLKSFITDIRKQVESSRNWLATTNARASKRNSYWGNVKTSGTKFMLSQERYMVTSTG